MKDVNTETAWIFNKIDGEKIRVAIQDQLDGKRQWMRLTREQWETLRMWMATAQDDRGLPIRVDPDVVRTERTGPPGDAEFMVNPPVFYYDPMPCPARGEGFK